MTGPSGLCLKLICYTDWPAWMSFLANHDEMRALAFAAPNTVHQVTGQDLRGHSSYGLLCRKEAGVGYRQVARTRTYCGARVSHLGPVRGGRDTPRQRPQIRDPHLRLLSPSSISEMSRNGVAFGSHDRAHRRLAGLAYPEVWDEVAGSKEDLERVLGLSVSTFAYPAEVFDRDVRQSIGACGYELAMAGNNGTDDPLALRRAVLGADDSLLTFVWRVWNWPARLHRRSQGSPLRRRFRGEAG
jgi:hypothetical protein